MRKSYVKIFVFYENTVVLLCMQFWKLGFALLQNEWIQGDSFTSTEIKGSVLPCLKAYFRIWGQGCGICTKEHQKPEKGQDKTQGAKEEKKLYDPFLWMRFNRLRATESQRRGSLLFTSKMLNISHVFWKGQPVGCDSDSCTQEWSRLDSASFH